VNRQSGPVDPDDEGEPIGPFRTWKALYMTVLLWAVVLIVLLYVFTRVFDRGVP
jgi:hypothetical protein